MKKSLKAILIFLSLFIIFSCSNSYIQNGFFVNDFVDLNDIPSKEDIINETNNEELERIVENAFGNKLWKGSFSLDNSTPKSLYINIKDTASNLIEFSNTITLKTYKYKVIKDNWIVLQNKTNTVTIKFERVGGNKIEIIIPINEYSNAGCKITLEECSEDVTFENNNNPTDEEIKIEEIPSEKLWKEVGKETLYPLIKDGNFSKVYYDFSSVYGGFDEFCKKGNVSITSDSISITGTDSSINVKYSISKVQQKVSDKEKVFIGTILINNSDNTLVPNGKYHLVFEKRDNDVKLMMIQDNLFPTFISTNEYSTEKMKLINFSNDVMDKLISLRVMSEEYQSYWCENKKMLPDDHGVPTFLDNKLYLDKKYVADYHVIESGYGENEARRMGYHPYALVKISNSQDEYINNTVFYVFITPEMKYFRWMAKGNTVLHICPKGTPMEMKASPREVFINELETNINVERKLKENGVEKSEPYKLIKEGEVYKIVSKNNDLYASFKVYETAIMGEVVHCAAIQIVDASNDSILLKDRHYVLFCCYPMEDYVLEGFQISNYDEDYLFTLITEPEYIDPKK